MIIKKIFNNNIVLSKDENGHDVVVMGCGIGFQKHNGDLVDEAAIEKIFSQIHKGIRAKFVALLNEIPLEYFILSEDIINEAKVKMGKQINENVLISLTDHIYFAIKRYKEGVHIGNGLLWEIKRLYSDEFELGKRSIDRINAQYDTMLPEDEAAFIALHLINAQLDVEIPTIVQMTKVMRGILEIVKIHFMIELDTNSLNYYRFITHLKFFSLRLVDGSSYKDEQDQDLFLFVKKKYTHAFACTEKIRNYVLLEFQYELSSEEMLYITVHLERLLKSSNKLAP